jgi:hypothetical protein
VVGGEVVVVVRSTMVVVVCDDSPDASTRELERSEVDDEPHPARTTAIVSRQALRRRPIRRSENGDIALYRTEDSDAKRTGPMDRSSFDSCSEV